MLSASSTVSLTKKHSLTSKWNILFDKSPEWISFKPQLGLKVYPCYACKNMFSSKLTFQDHINRRVIIVKYKCVDCTNTLTFYNRCSFLLHTRKHYQLGEGKVNLANVDILLLPVELAGFARHESIPFLYDEDEEYVIHDDLYVNAQFYTPDDSEAGKQIITLRPYNLVFHYTEGDNNVLMVLKQIASNIPLCEFVNQDFNKQSKNTDKGLESDLSANIMEPEIKLEPDNEEFMLPVISKIESLNDVGSKTKYPTCPECLTVQEISMKSHFLGTNKPADQDLYCYVCKYICPTKCSLKAHVRTHESSPPFVCPECGTSFSHDEELTNHMEDVCFHLAKQVRFRCLAQKCGKIFVMPNTYASHFVNHFQYAYQCNVCNQTFTCELEFGEHSKTHDSCAAVKLFKCLVCRDASAVNEDKSADHINFHLQDREICVYIFTCKFCRSYFRSTATYAVHKQRCAKRDKSLPPLLINSTCHFCGQKVVFREKDTYKICIFCKQLNQPPVHNTKANISLDEKKVICMLCKEELLPENKKIHSQLCKYNNPVVTIQNLSSDSTSDENTSNEKSNTSNSDLDNKIINLDSSSESPRSSEGPKKKRKRSVGLNSKNKKNESMDSIKDLQADQPISFDGTYYCKLCDYKNSVRTEFHDHIVNHRDVSTAFQCMECGECFVVKPSLVKHLTHYHKIGDLNEYFLKNDCFDKFAVEELESNLKLLRSERKGPLKENQCTVCYDQFDTPLALSKHFRIHGMAFLMKTTK